MNKKKNNNNSTNSFLPIPRFHVLHLILSVYERWSRAFLFFFFFLGFRCNRTNFVECWWRQTFYELNLFSFDVISWWKKSCHTPFDKSTFTGARVVVEMAHVWSMKNTDCSQIGVQKHWIFDQSARYQRYVYLYRKDSKLAKWFNFSTDRRNVVRYTLAFCFVGLVFFFFPVVVVVDFVWMAKSSRNSCATWNITKSS